MLLFIMKLNRFCIFIVFVYISGDKKIRNTVFKITLVNFSVLFFLRKVQLFSLNMDSVAKMSSLDNALTEMHQILVLSLHWSEVSLASLILLSLTGT